MGTETLVPAAAMPRIYCLETEMIASQFLGFHESTIVQFETHGADLELILDDVVVNGKKSTVSLKVTSIAYAAIDGVQSDLLAMEAEDGEVLTLDISDSCLWLMVEWNDFCSRKSITREYKVCGNSVSVSIL